MMTVGTWALMTLIILGALVWGGTVTYMRRWDRMHGRPDSEPSSLDRL